MRAIRTYTDNHVGALNFVEGDCITVRENDSFFLGWKSGILGSRSESIGSMAWFYSSRRSDNSNGLFSQ